MSISFGISPRKIALVLGGISLLLCLTSIVLKNLEWGAGVNLSYWLYNLADVLNVNHEANIPTWYSSMLLLTCAILLGIISIAISRKGLAYRFRWMGLSLIFFYLALDESAALHEKITTPLQEGLNLTGHLYFGWVIVGALVVLIIGLLYASFVWHLPSATRRHFIIAGFIYVLGALGIESISANIWYQKDGTSLLYSTIGTIEECCEMLGIVIFIYGLLSYLPNQLDSLTIRFEQSEADKNLDQMLNQQDPQ